MVHAYLNPHDQPQNSLPAPYNVDTQKTKIHRWIATVWWRVWGENQVMSYETIQACKQPHHTVLKCYKFKERKGKTSKDLEQSHKNDTLDYEVKKNVTSN